jgi:inward rectifier potassium channel
MKKATFDPGLTQKFTGVLRRSINKDGSFNVRRQGGSWRHLHPYLTLLNMNWMEFFLLVFAAYCVVNLLFAVGYFLLGPGALQGVEATTPGGRFLTDFFFSAHTLTTVGYGNIYPESLGANIISTIEALVGLLSAALGTGLLFGRFSRPSARIAFSDRILVAPYEDRSSVQFRILNLRPNVLMEVQAHMVLMTVEGPPGALTRKYQPLKLERDDLYFLALSWTIVHPIDEESPLFGKTREDLASLQAEFVIMIKAFDDTFAQAVHARYSYRYDEVTWQARFQPAFEIDSEGNMVLHVDRVSSQAAIAGNS